MMKTLPILLALLLLVPAARADEPVAPEAPAAAEASAMEPAMADSSATPDTNVRRTFPGSAGKIGGYMLAGSLTAMTIMVPFVLAECIPSNGSGTCQAFEAGSGLVLAGMALGSILLAIDLIDWAAANKTSQSGIRDSATVLLPGSRAAPRTVPEAYTWVAAATLLPVAMSGLQTTDDAAATLILAAANFGPSAGQAYARSWGAALAGVGLRVAGFGVIVATNGHEAGIISGAALFFGGLGYSLVDTYFAVNRANERARKKAGVQTSFAPALFPVGDGRLAPGLALSATF